MARLRLRPISLALLSRFGIDRRGVSALEFALIAPVLLLIYFGVGSLCEAMMAQRRIAHAASAIGDLTTQSTTLAASDVSDIFAAGSTIMSPFATTSLKLRLTSVTANSAGNPLVDWSCATNGLAANTAGATYLGLPSGLVSVAGDSIVVAEGQYTWAAPVQVNLPGYGSFLPTSLPLKEIFYLKPRKSNQVAGPASC